jgi:hypothetical protein
MHGLACRTVIFAFSDSGSLDSAVFSISFRRHPRCPF